MDRAVIDVSQRDSADIYLSKFANGQLVAENADQFSFTAYEEKASRITRKIKEPRKRTLVCTTENMKYSGSERDQTAPLSSSMCKHMIAAYNKKTHKIRFYDVRMMHMKPDFEKPEEESKEDESDLSFREKVDNLTSAFGGIKKRRAMESRIRNKIGTDSLDAALTSVVDDVMKRDDVEALVAKAPVVSATVEIIPPHDKDATSPAEVYKLEDIVSAENLSAVSGPAQDFIYCTKENLKEWTHVPKFILNHLNILPLEGSTRTKKAQVLKYLHFLIILYMRKAKVLQSKQALPAEVPEIIKKSLFSQFTVESKNAQNRTYRAVPARLKDKLLCYILVLCLILENFELDISSLMSDLTSSKVRITTMLQSLGCRVNFTKPVNVGDPVTGTATLPVPLHIPEHDPKKMKAKR